MNQKDSLISRQAAIDVLKKNTFRLTFAEEQNCEGHVAWSAYAAYSDVMEGELLELPSAQPEPNLDSIVSEIKKTISETKENGKYHCANIRINGEMICFGLQLALEIIEEKRNEQSDKQTGSD